MTEQEAFNDLEMKTLILLSGYVRELGEGKDYETTTYKLAETIVNMFSIDYHTQKRDLLIGLLTKIENDDISSFDKEQIVDDYLVTKRKLEDKEREITIKLEDVNFNIEKVE
jgi:hypothetical protein